MGNQVYLQQGRTFRPADPSAINMKERLAAGTYSVGCDPKGFFLERMDNFTLPAKLYGNVNKLAERILATFASRPAGTGVLLSGQAGAGKTMLTKRISQLGLASDIITLVVNQPLCGEAFNTFIQSIEQPAVVLFDEFEKVYDQECQQALLTILDGTYASKKLFLLTCNDRYRINSYMLNRPGRLFYALDFKGLDRAFIEDYCADNLKNAVNTRGVVNVAQFFDQFSFDMLKALVEEMNRYGETATEAMELLNMKPASENGGVFDVVLKRNGVPLLFRHGDSQLAGNPLSRAGYVLDFYAADKDEGEEPRAGEITEDEKHKIDVNKLIKVDTLTGTFIFGTERPDTTLEFTRRVTATSRFDYDAF